MISSTITLYIIVNLHIDDMEDDYLSLILLTMFVLAICFEIFDYS